jgi:hypothetical protein
LKDLTIGEFTLPIDQKVAALLIHKTIWMFPCAFPSSFVINKYLMKFVALAY